MRGSISNSPRRARRRSTTRSFRRRRTAEEQAGRHRCNNHAEDVIAVGREHMHRSRCRRGCRLARPRVFQLRRRSWQLECRLRRRARGIANGERRNPACGTQVALHQRGRKGLNVGDVVEAATDRVGGQERGRVDDPNKVLDRPCVFGAVQTLERPPPRVRAECGAGVHLRFEAGQSDRGCRASGRLAPAGGIMPTRSLRIIFSATAPLSAARAASKEASVRPPAFPRSLWQLTQVLLDEGCLLFAGDRVGRSRVRLDDRWHTPGGGFWCGRLNFRRARWSLRTRCWATLSGHTEAEDNGPGERNENFPHVQSSPTAALPRGVYGEPLREPSYFQGFTRFGCHVLSSARAGT